jgi:hypothetical protein
VISYILVTVLCGGAFNPEIPDKICTTTKSKTLYKSKQECDAAFLRSKKSMEDAGAGDLAKAEPHKFYYSYTGHCEATVKNTSK